MLPQIKNRPIRKKSVPKKHLEGRRDGYLTLNWRDEDPCGADTITDPIPFTMARLARGFLSEMGGQRRKRGKRRYGPVLFFNTKMAGLREMSGHSSLVVASTPSNRSRKRMRCIEHDKTRSGTSPLR